MNDGLQCGDCKYASLLFFALSDAKKGPPLALGRIGNGFGMELWQSSPLIVDSCGLDSSQVAAKFHAQCMMQISAYLLVRLSFLFQASRTITLRPIQTNVAQAHHVDQDRSMYFVNLHKAGKGL